MLHWRFVLLSLVLVSCSRLGVGSTTLDSSVVGRAGESKVIQTTLASGLERPWGMTWLSEEELLITLRPGRVVLFSLEDRVVTPVSDFPPVFVFGQGGLLDVAVHPEFEQNRWVYFSFSEGDRDQNRTVVARATLENNQLTQWETIFSVADWKSGAQHFGSRLLWLEDGTLLISIGDGGNPPIAYQGELIRTQAQNLKTHFGKVIRINDDGSIPKDNPFVSNSEARPEIWSLGHRNIQGMAIDPATGKIWTTEHGARGGDELNEINSGQNYGWPLVSFSREYQQDQPVAPSTSRPGFVDPNLEWTPSIAPSGLAVYRGDRYPEWDGTLFSGALVNQSIIQVQVEDDGRAKSIDELPIGQRVRDIRQGPDGYLYVLTDSKDGRLVRLEPQS